MPGVVVLELDLVFDLVDQNLRQEDANQLWYGQSQGYASQKEHVTVDPVHQCVYAAVGVDVASSFNVLQQLHAVTAHGVDDLLVFGLDAAGEGDGAALSAGVVLLAGEVHVLGPVGVRHTAAAAKLFLTKVNEVLQINVLSVVDNGVIDHLRHSMQSFVREDEGQNPSSQLEQEDQGQTDTEGLQKADVFSQGAHAATEGDDEHEEAHDH